MFTVLSFTKIFLSTLTIEYYGEPMYKRKKEGIYQPPLVDLDLCLKAIVIGNGIDGLFVWFYGISTIVGYLMLNPLIHIY